MVAYLEKTDGNTDFYEIIELLTRSSIHYALTISLVVSTTFVEQFWMSVKSKIINNVRYITAKVVGKPITISEASIRSDLLFDDAGGIDSMHNQAIFDAIKLMRHLDAKKKFVMYPRFIPVFLTNQLKNVPVPLDHFPINALTTNVFSFMVKKGKSFSGNVTPLFPSMLAQPTEDEGAVTTQATQIKDLKSQIKQLKKKAKAGRKFAKSTPTAHTDQIFDDVDVNDAMDYMETMLTCKSQNKAKQKGVEIKDAEDSDRPRATSTRSVLTLKPLPKIDPKDKGKKVLEEEAESDVELEGVDEAERKFDQLTKDEEIARKVEESKEVPCSTKRYCNQKQTTTELQLKNQNDDLSEACRRKEAC
ncbi:hypothetical protein Tco_0455914 [Tanacetum coccineum]